MTLSCGLRMGWRATCPLVRARKGGVVMNDAAGVSGKRGKEISQSAPAGSLSCGM
jgi:hypothetical protein